MDKQTLIRDIRVATGEKRGMISQRQIARYMGIHESNIKPVLSGLEYISTGRVKRYLIADVADLILNMRQSG